MVKIGIYNLDNKEITKMKNMLGKSHNKNVEYASNICVDPTKKELPLKIESICKGTECQVLLPSECKNGKVLIGDYHTHITKEGADIPSILDLKAIVKDAMSMMCIGSTQKNIINCYTRKTPKEISHAKFLVDLDIRTRRGIKKLADVHKQNPDEFQNEHIKVVRDILEKQFDNTKIQ